MSTTPPTGPAAELCARVQGAAADTPYRVTPTPDGFDVAVDIDTPQWRGLLYNRSTKEVFTHHVDVDEQGRKISITDELHALEWATAADPGATPDVRLGARLGVHRGRVIQFSFHKSIGTSEDGSVGVVDDYSFSSEDGRRLIEDAADELGWTQRLSTDQKIGLVAGVFGGVVALGVLVALVIVALVAK